MTKPYEFIGIPRFKLNHLNYFTFLFLLALLTLLRNGFSFFGTAWRMYNSETYDFGDVSLRDKLLFVVHFFDQVGQEYGALAFFVIMSMTVLIFLLLIECQGQQ